MGHRSRIMYIEHKIDGIARNANIGRVTFSKTGKSLYYRGKTFKSLNGRGFKSNYYDIETRERYWISGCKKNGADALYPNRVEIDDDVWEEYWSEHFFVQIIVTKPAEPVFIFCSRFTLQNSN
jgi:hypothetical protein